MSEVRVLALKALAGGTLVVVFALLGERLRPQSLAGVLAAALMSRPRDHPDRGEACELAVATSSLRVSHRFTAHRGREGNWGEAVLVSVHFLCALLRQGEAAAGGPRSAA